MRHTLPLASLAIASMASLCPALAPAAPLTPDQALARALAAPEYPARATRAEAPEYQLAYTSSIPGSDSPGCYLFRSDAGFVIASADDRARPLLAYGSDNSFDTSRLSPEFEYWLSEYGREMAAVPDTPDVDPGIKYPSSEISPICHTKWNQFGPYYDLCSQVYGQPVVTGCVATALSQILKVHNWPPTGAGSITYHSDGREFSFDYATADFDWQAMLDVYHADSSKESKAAVAELMYAAGVAVGMHYHPGGSGADPAVMCGSLPPHMRYDVSIYNAQRFYYTLQEWTDLIYAQLQKGLPVQYSGYVSSGGGHSFVCDGYSQNGYFHFNWGWGGASDGYYLLSALSPDHRGIGPAEARGGFNFNQDAVINILPEQEGSVPYFGVMNASNFGVAQSWSWLDKEIGIRGIYWNTGCTRISGQFGVEATPASGQSIILPGRVVDTYGINEALGGYSVKLPESLPEGTYTLTPVFKYLGQWLPIKTAVDQRSEEFMTVEKADGKLKAVFTEPADGGSISVIDLKAPARLDPRHYSSVTGTIQNTTPEEWTGAVAAALFTSDHKLMAYGLRMELDLLPDTEQPLDYSSEMRYTVLPDSLHDGPAYICIIDYYNHRPISEALPVEIVDLAQSGIAAPRPSLSAEAEVTVYTLQGAKVGSGKMPQVMATLPKGLYICTDPRGQSRKILK